MFEEFLIVKEENLYCIVFATNDSVHNEYIKLKTRDGSQLISHENEEFINFIISDLKRLGFPEINPNGIIMNDIPFSGYYIFNNQKLVTRQEILNELLPAAILNDKILIQTFNGPPLEMYQLDRLIPVRDAVEEEFGKTIFQNITEFAWGTYYKNMIAAELDENNVFFDYKSKKEVISREDFIKENWGGPGKEISIKKFKTTLDFQKIYDHFNSLNDEQLAVIFSLFFWNDKLSILNTFLLVKGKINKSKFIEAMLAVNHDILDSILMLNEKDSNQHLSNAYSLYNDDVSVALEYLKNSGTAPDQEHKKFIKKLIYNHENKTTELKSSFFRCQRTKNKDVIIMHEAIKAIAGFQNATGGHLIIGVNDSGEVLGVDICDEFKDKDTYSQRVEQHIAKCLGHNSLSNLEIRFVELDKKIVCHLEIKTNLPTFCKDRAYNKKTKKPENESIFYLRQNNMTATLNSEETVNYIQKTDS